MFCCQEDVHKFSLHFTRQRDQIFKASFVSQYCQKYYMLRLIFFAF